MGLSGRTEIKIGVREVNKIKNKAQKVASSANEAVYDSEKAQDYVDGAPHIKHYMLRELYGELVVDVYNFATNHTSTPKVLDLGAGEGSVTLPFLELGAKVTAVDISEDQLENLKAKAADYVENIEVRCQDVFEATKSLQSDGDKYDIIVANSFLHHIPDYQKLIRQSISLLSPYGQFFSFQDSLRYDSVGKINRIFSKSAYFSWRIFKGDVLGGLKRRLRRSRGIYLEDCPEDNAEYHVTRNGVDQEAILKLLTNHDFECEIIRYFSTQSSLWQPIGKKLGIENTFGLIARRNFDHH